MAEQHIVLCGDSIIDNGSYVNQGEPDVHQQVKDLMPDSKVTLLAVDGNVTKDIEDQMNNLPKDATHIFISIGGNDGYDRMNIFDESTNTIGDAMSPLYEMRNEFEIDYNKMLKNVLSYEIPTTLCSIYYPRFDKSDNEGRRNYLGGKNNQVPIKKMAMVGLSMYNDIITKEAFQVGLPLIDLRVLCNDDKDFANPIEPSAIGGEKIATAIKEIVCSHDFSKNVSVVYC